MNTFTKLAAGTLAALLLTTSMASAFGPVIDVQPSGPITVGGDYSPVSVPPSDPITVNGDYSPVGIPGSVPVNVDGDYSPINIPSKGQGKGQGGNNRSVRTMDLAFACTIGKSANLVVSNKGDAVPAGTKFRWEVRSVGERGFFRLENDLASGEKVRVDIGGGVDIGTPCAAKVI